MTTRIRATWILAYDESTQDHALLTDGQVLIDGSVVQSVGPFDGGVSFDDEIDLGRSLVMPGFIDLDAVTDIDHALLDSFTDRESSPGFDWSLDYALNRRHHVFSADERRTVRRFALAQLLLNGVTTAMPIAAETHSDWAESFDDFVAVTEEAESLGIRLYAGPSYRSSVNVIDESGHRSVHEVPELGRDGFLQALSFVDWIDERRSPLVRGALLPCRVESVTDEIIEATAAASRDRGVPMRLHALQGLTERDRIAERSGETPLQLLERLGVLGPNLVIPHGIFVDGDAQSIGRDRQNGITPDPSGGIELLAERGVTIVHCPLTSARYGTALRTVRRYLDAGVRIALGTDSFPPDLIRGIDLGSQIAKVLSGQLDEAPVENYVRAGTLTGAAALGRDDLGRIRPGAQADLVAYRLDTFRDGVTDDPVRTLFMNGTARAAVMTMVAGRVRARDGVIPGVDLDALRAEAQSLFERMRGAYSERDVARRPVSELFPPTFRAWAAHPG